MKMGFSIESSAISALEVEGFKSLAERTRVQIRPLTILAGANSSGKSSALQPLLLLKQTLDASYDPGPLLLHDSHVRFTSTDQLLTRRPRRARVTEFVVGVEAKGGTAVELRFQAKDLRVDLVQTTWRAGARCLVFTPSMSDADIREELLGYGAAGSSSDSVPQALRPRGKLKILRQRSFLIPSSPSWWFFEEWLEPFDFGEILEAIAETIHLPGLRGNPERSYRTTAVGRTFPGTFDHYVASVILAWQSAGDEKLSKLDDCLGRLDLTWRVRARQLDASQVELQVGRLPRPRRGGAKDLVNIADVGFGVSQILPVLVALLTAKPGQLVYIEQPELHLHPRAQAVLAELLAEAADRGVRVVAETHSALLLLSLQTLVGQGKIDPEKVILHWFERNPDGSTKVTSADLDRDGAYGDWPEDFGEVTLDAESSYLDAAEAGMRVRSAGR